MTQKTLRDEIAMAAMQGDWASQNEDCGYFVNVDQVYLEKRATLYFRMADAFLAARGEQEADYPECSGNPNSCPENEGRGCCNRSEKANHRPVTSIVKTENPTMIMKGVFGAYAKPTHD